MLKSFYIISIHNAYNKDKQRSNYFFQSQWICSISQREYLIIQCYPYYSISGITSTRIYIYMCHIIQYHNIHLKAYSTVHRKMESYFM